MNRCMGALVALLLIAAPARTGTDPKVHSIPGAKSAAGISGASSKRLATSLGASFTVRAFAVSQMAPSKNDPADREALKTDGVSALKTGFAAIYPNPTNPTASIRYALAEPAHVRLAIYAVNGELVCVLVNDAQSAGEYDAHWNGSNERGIAVASGLYFARLEAGARLFTRKLVVAR